MSNTSLGENRNVEVSKTVSAPPDPRVGAVSVAIGDKVYLFGGRGGESMTALEERGAIWVFDTTTSVWAQLSLATPSEIVDKYPQARSYHCASSDGSDRIFIHAGCPASGRLADLWSYSTVSRTWIQHEDAPGPSRGGPSIAYSNGLLYRMNGFDGKTEQGGCLDIFTLSTNSWQTKHYKADGISGPAPRSVSALLPVEIHGKTILVTLLGEGDPSSLGHAGAGKMFDDIWAYDIEDDKWQKVETSGSSPRARGWFDADVTDDQSIFVAGGLGEDNERLDDAWILNFGTK